MIRRVVSGGQTGVDRAALDAARTSGISIAGWCPRGRRADDGRIPAAYPLKETPSEAYEQRTVWNVRDSDGTLIVDTGAESGGTALTGREARRKCRPVKTVHLPTDASDSQIQKLVADVDEWIATNSIHVLNIAGPRESEAPRIYDVAYRFLTRLFRSQQ